MDSATIPSASHSGLSHDGVTREPIAARVFTVSLLAPLVGLLLGGREALLVTLANSGAELAFWIVLVMIMNVFPIMKGEWVFTLDMPLLVATALLYPPPVAALIAFVGAIDLREITRRIAVSRAMFNRIQLAISVYFGGLTFRLFATGLEPWTAAILATAAAILVSYTLNMVLVSMYRRLRLKTRLRSSVKDLTVGRLGQFLATYFSYGVLAVVIAFLFRDVGAWAVVTFLVPALVARQMLLRGQRVQALAEQLRYEERLLHRLFDRIVEERRDERLRIAGDLQDHVLQSLIRMSQLSQLIRRELPGGAQASRDAEELEGTALDSIDALREVVGDLRDSPLGRGGLVPTLDNLARDLQLDWSVRIRVDAALDKELTPSIQVIAYQIAREGVLNALKHAKASLVRVIVRTGRSNLVIGVDDDGSGFDPSGVDASRHFGLGLMQERVRMAGGELRIEPKRGEGTRLRATLPLSPPPRHEDGR